MVYGITAIPMTLIGHYGYSPIANLFSGICRTVLHLNRHSASRGLSETAELLKPGPH